MYLPDRMNCIKRAMVRFAVGADRATAGNASTFNGANGVLPVQTRDL